MKYVSVSKMVAIEKEADASGHSYAQMMEHAGRGLAEVIVDAYSHVGGGKILSLVGSGNNGGDALVAFCYLQAQGWQTTTYVVRPRKEDDPLVARLENSGGVVFHIGQDPDLAQLVTEALACDVLVDGILGTGIRLPLRAPISDVLRTVRKTIDRSESKPAVVAVDCPSGIDCDTGAAAEECLPATLTVTMAAVKQGLLKFPAYSYVGDLRLVGIGLPPGLPAYDEIRREVVDRCWVKNTLPARPLNGHKGTFGTALVVGGAIPYCGAPLLAGESAFRIGAGWVTLAVPAPVQAGMMGQFIEATWLPLPDARGFISKDAAGTVLENLEKPTAILIGPGMGLQKTTGAFIKELLKDARFSVPLVVDADGLKLLAQIPDWSKQLPPDSVLTPHPGEMRVLTNLSSRKIQEDRLSTAEKYARKWRQIVVLKGAFTVVAAPDGRTAVIPIATPALGRAGTGDVLAGMIVGLRAQGLPAFEAAAAAAWIHGTAGLYAAEVLGSSAAVLAGDVLAAGVDVLAEVVGEFKTPSKLRAFRSWGSGEET